MEPLGLLGALGWHSQALVVTCWVPSEIMDVRCSRCYLNNLFCQREVPKCPKVPTAPCLYLEVRARVIWNSAAAIDLDFDLDFLLLSFKLHFTVQWEPNLVSVAQDSAGLTVF